MPEQPEKHPGTTIAGTGPDGGRPTGSERTGLYICLGDCNTKHRNPGPNGTCPACGLRGTLAFRPDLDPGEEFDPRALPNLSDYHRRYPYDLSNVYIVLIDTEDFCGRDAFLHVILKQFPLEVSEIIDLRKFHGMEWDCPACKSKRCPEYPGSYCIKAIKTEILQARARLSDAARSLNNDIRTLTQEKFPGSTSGMLELTMGFLFLQGRYARYVPEIGFHFVFLLTADVRQRLDNCQRH